MTDATSLQVSTHVKAPRDKVYAAFVTPDILSRWFAPGTRKARAEQLNVRPGGRYRIVVESAGQRIVAIGVEDFVARVTTGICIITIKSVADDLREYVLCKRRRVRCGVALK